jgi:hypothetical protein
MACSAKDLANAASQFQGVAPGALPWIQTYLLCQILQQSNPMANCDPSALAEAAKCFCGLSALTLQQIQTELLCEILQAGGNTGNSCLIFGPSDPVAAPPCNDAIAINTTTNNLFWWDSTIPGWNAFSV